MGCRKLGKGRNGFVPSSRKVARAIDAEKRHPRSQTLRDYHSTALFWSYLVSKSLITSNKIGQSWPTECYHYRSVSNHHYPKSKYRRRRSAHRCVWPYPLGSSACGQRNRVPAV